MKNVTSVEYIARNGQICPFCGSDTVDFVSDANYSDSKIEEEKGCLSCKKTWVEEYRLVGWRKGTYTND